MIIRKAKKSDIDDILVLAEELIKTEAPLDKTHNLKEEVNEGYKERELKTIASRKKIYLVAEENNKVIGYVNGFIAENAEIYFKEPIAYLHHLCVDTAYRKQGIGTKLIDEFSKAVKDKGAKYVKLNAFEDNTPAVNLYKKEGFEEYSVYYMKKI